MTEPETRGENSGHGRKLGALVAAFAVAIALPWLVLALTGGFASGSDEASSSPASSLPPQRLESPPATSAPEVAGPLRSAGVPIRVSVAALGVRSVVVPISGNSGALVPPADPRTLGWWQEGQVVGAAAGATVITGHTVHTGGGALDDLGSLQVRDQVIITTRAGRVTYEVRRVVDVPPAKLAKQAPHLFDAAGDPRLVLITCSDWNGSEYLSNTVVSAVPVKDRPA